MIQARGELDLAQESLRTERRGDVGMKHLERDESFMFRILRQIHSCHSAAAKLAVDGVCIRHCPAKTLERQGCVHHMALAIVSNRGMPRSASRSGS